jgi:hypothetical protein
MRIFFVMVLGGVNLMAMGVRGASPLRSAMADTSVKDTDFVEATDPALNLKARAEGIKRLMGK